MNRLYLLIFVNFLYVQFLTAGDTSAALGGLESNSISTSQEIREKLKTLQFIAQNQKKNNNHSAMLLTLEEMLRLSQEHKLYRNQTFANSELGKYYLSIKDYNKSYSCFIEVQKICQSQGLSQVIALKNLVILFRKKNEQNSAIIYQKKLLNLKEIKSDKKEFSRASGLLSNIYLKVGELQLALKYAIQQLEIAREIKRDGTYGNDLDNFRADKFYYKIGKIYLSMGNHQLSLDNFFKALSIATGENDLLKAGRYQTSIGSAYYSKNELDSSLIYCLSALNIAKNRVLLGEDPELEFKVGYGSLLNNIGLIYKKKGNYEKALQSCLQSVDIKERSNVVGIENSYSGLAEIYLLLKKPRDAKKYIDKFTSLIDSSDINNNDKQRHFLLSSYYEQVANAAKALFHQKIYTQIKDSIYQSQIAETVSKIQLSYKNKISEQDNAMLQAENLSRTILFTTISIAGLLISFILFSKLRAKKKSEKILTKKNKLILSKHDELELLYENLQENERKLEEANKAKDKFLSIIGHDLKNPLHSLFLSTEMIYTYFDKYSQEQLIEKIKKMNQSAKSASDLLQNLLTWARSQSGKIIFHQNRIKIYYIIKEIYGLVQSSAQNKNIKLLNEVPQETEVYADENMINTVIRNLITNSIKFTAISGVISIECKELKEFVKFTIEDTGMGMSLEECEGLFKIDSSLRKNGTSGEQGTGLGLILCKEFIHYHGGNIWAESTLGVGTKFHFTLPKFNESVQVIESKMKVID